MRKRFLMLTVLLAATCAVEAATWWILPSNYFFEVGETAKIGFVQGEEFKAEPWPLTQSQVVRLEHYRAGLGVKDLRASIQNDDRERLAIKFDRAGTQLLALQSAPQFKAWDAAEFNAFLEENGLETILAKRKESRTSDKPAGERQVVYTKLLIQVGDTPDDVYKKAVGFPLEIIPERNPYSLRTGDVMRFKILKDGKPLFGARVKVWNRKDNRTTLQNIYTEKDGTMETRLSSAGPWMVSVVQTEPSKIAGTEWNTASASLVFGIR
ncbi:DUF4198 domain-containing protein [Dawidia soli]|uniref:DUF4198 domain-containing protein n=1 Tax=Dawidia soli TaxID=2782352 RepID=A0AAP2DDC4_9BACT|nr:DUF4198 domain-containing protein [Dawidia soli]MBT1689604.1 DUF4198 domain-containing protein [Dawidia soli]